ncbi:MAG: hypothetical protein WC959_05500 [Kiritimatiellales bacterium]
MAKKATEAKKPATTKKAPAKKKVTIATLKTAQENLAAAQTALAADPENADLQKAVAEAQAVLDALPPPAEPVPAISVTCKRPGGLWRAGRHWPKGQTIVAVSEFSPEQIAAIRAETRFTVQDGMMPV